LFNTEVIMGTDIHGVWQRRNVKDKTWEDIPSEYDQNRHYQLFAVLADVRNGYGFAGCVLGEAVEPISLPRGLPPDFKMDTSDEGIGCHTVPSLECVDPDRRKWAIESNRDPIETMAVWMGDHSHSYLTGAEMLRWYKKAPTVIKCGVLSREQYEAWDHVSPPEEYCGDIWGKDVIKVTDSKVAMEQEPKWTHVRVEWKRSLHEELDYFFNEVQRLVDLHGDIRFVFGFDS
jgi:hypothetical protein